MILRLPAKPQITGWRTNIEFERFFYILKLALPIAGLALLLLIAERFQKKGGAGWLDFSSNFGKNLVILVPVIKKKLTPGAIVAIAIGGIIIAITLSLMESEEEVVSTNPLDMKAPQEATPPPTPAR